MRPPFLSYPPSTFSWTRLAVRAVNVAFLAGIAAGCVRAVHAFANGWAALGVGYLLHAGLLFLALWIATQLREMWRERRL
jgi:hypothetical protein